MNTEKFEGQYEGWRTLWVAIATNKPVTGNKKTTSFGVLSYSRRMFENLQLDEPALNNKNRFAQGINPADFKIGQCT